MPKPTTFQLEQRASLWCIVVLTVKEGVLNHGSLVSRPFVTATGHMLRLNEFSQCNGRNTAIGQKYKQVI